MKLILLTLAFTSLAFSFTNPSNDDPVPQRWTDTWQMPFSESLKLGWDNYLNNVTGMFYYDWPGKRMRITRTSCRGDRFGGNTRLFDNSPCDHIITAEGKDTSIGQRGSIAAIVVDLNFALF